MQQSETDASCINEQTFTDPDQHIEVCDHINSHAIKHNLPEKDHDLLIELCLHGDLKHYEDYHNREAYLQQRTLPRV